MLHFIKPRWTPPSSDGIGIGMLMNSARPAIISFVVFVLPTVAAIWCVPWFVTQDGPSHLYNAYLMSELLKGHSPAQEFYTLNWMPLPNVAGHWLLVALLQFVSPRTADRILMTLTSVGLAGALVWLRWRVAGRNGMAFIIPLATLIALNTMWLKGFYNFLLGVSLFSITLGYWWANRERMGLKQSAILAVLLILVYFSHLVTALLTVFALGLLCIMTPAYRYKARYFWTAISLTPLIPLGLLYSRLMQEIGRIQPRWTRFPEALSALKDLAGYVNSADLFTTSRISIPLLEWTTPRLLLLRPSLWLALGLSVLIVGTLLSHLHEAKVWLRNYSAWIILASCLILAWVAGPNSFGVHGGLFRMRVLLLAVIALIPILNVVRRNVCVWIGAGGLTVALIIQSAAVWDIALTTDRSAPVFIEAIPEIGTGKRIGMLRIDMPERGSVYPLLHMDNMIGIGTGNVVWHNYEAATYYFPVQHRGPANRNLVKQFDRIHLIRTDASDLDRKLERWTQLLSEHHSKIDILMVWGRDPKIDEINRQWYRPEPFFQRDNLRAFARH